MLTIYGNPISGPSNKVRFVANYLGLDYDFRNINLMAGEQKSAEFLKRNPVGRVPVIEDGGFTLFESGAITKYLASKHKSDLYPEDIETRAKIDQCMDFCSIHIDGAMRRVVFNKLIVKFIPGETVDERSMADGQRFLSQFLPVIDSKLSRHSRMVGNNLTLADFNLLAILDPCEAAGVDLSPYPNITQWRDELRSQDWYTKCHKNFEETLMAFR